MTTKPAPRLDPPSPSRPRAGGSVLLIPVSICSECGEEYRHKVQKMNNGKVTGIALFCDTCFHGKQVSVPCANAENTDWQPPDMPCPKCANGNLIEWRRGQGFRCAEGHKFEEQVILDQISGKVAETEEVSVA